MSEYFHDYVTISGSVRGSQWEADQIGFPESYEKRIPFLGYGEGDYIVRIVDVQGQVLFYGYFNPSPVVVSGVAWDLDIYSGRVPFFPEASVLEIRREATGERMWHHDFKPDEAPMVQIVEAPHGPISEPFMVEWEAQDPNDRDLTYSLQYSIGEVRNSNHGWFDVVEYLPPSDYRLPYSETQIVIDPKYLPGSIPCLGNTPCGSKFRVVASNGYSFSISEQDGSFIVPIKPPNIEVHGGQYYQHAPYGQAAGQWGVTLRGVDLSLYYYQYHDDGENVTWHSNLDGFLTRGRNFYGSGLSLGEHVISIQIEDIFGNTTSEEVLTITLVDDRPEIQVRVGDGSDDDLQCNEIEINVNFSVIGMSEIVYDFNPRRGKIMTEISDLSALPIRYQMASSTDVYVYAKNLSDVTSSYREVLDLVDCVEDDDGDHE